MLDAIFQKLRTLNEPVPKPLGLPSIEELEIAETALGVQFHPDFKRYLLEVSDVVVGTIEPVTIGKPDSHTDLIKITKDARDYMKLPNTLVPICEDNSDLYCINSVGEIEFHSNNGVTDETWPNIAVWIDDVWIGRN